MSLLDIARAFIRKPLNAIGLDVVRWPHWPPAESDPRQPNKFAWLSRLEIRTVVDIGAHMGEFATMIHRALPQASILSFEPLEHCGRQLRLNMRDVPNFTAFSCAIGDVNARMEMHRNEFSPSSSLLEMAGLHRSAFPYTVHETKESIEVRRLDDVLRNVHLEDHILVKIDVQGYEDRVISGGEDLLSRARLVIVETSFKTLYEGQPLFDEIYRALTRKGFRYMGNFDQLVSPADGSVLQADAVFQRQ